MTLGLGLFAIFLWTPDFLMDVPLTKIVINALYMGLVALAHPEQNSSSGVIFTGKGRGTGWNKDVT